MNSSTEITFREWLKRQRKAYGLTQEQLADRIGCAAITLRKIESEERRPSVQIVERLAEIFNLPQNEHVDFLRFARGDWTKALGVGNIETPWSISASNSRPRNNLPTQLSTFIGREKEIREVKNVLNSHRLVTLTGSGGTGKTRLSLRVAEELLDEFDYIWFVDLAPVTDPDNIPQIILSVIGLSEQQGRIAQELISEYLKDKNTLIILDNCEHLIEASAKISYSLLNHAPELKILASSREALGVNGEMIWLVPSLSLPDMNHLPDLDELVKYEALQLFVERSILAKPNFTITKENAVFIAQICSRLDGIPLAIELAASHIKALSMEQIAARLDDSFRMLTGGSRTALPRQQTLRATIDWSYKLLTIPERALLRHLTVFSGGWTLEAAELVCHQSGSEFDILDLLTQLADKSLVNPQDSRYRMLETTRQFAREKLLDAGEGQAIHDKHLRYFLDLAKQADKEIRGPGQVEWLDVLEIEHDNYRSALNWCISSGQTESALYLIGSFSGPGRLWSVRSYFSEARNWLDKVRLLSDVSCYPLAYATALNGVAFIAGLQGDSSAAFSMAEESQYICQLLGDEGQMSLAEALFAIGLAEFWSDGDMVRMGTCFEQAAAIYQAYGDRWDHALALLRLGMLASTRENYELAQQYFEESLVTFTEYRDAFALGRVHQELGWVYQFQGDYVRARKMFEQAMIYNRQLRFHNAIYSGLTNLGVICRLLGDYAQAEVFLEEALNLGMEFNMIADSAAQFYLGCVRLHHEDYLGASLCFNAHLKINLKLATKVNIGESLVGLAAVAAGLRQDQRAALLAGASQALHDEIPWKMESTKPIEIDEIVQCARERCGHAQFETWREQGRGLGLERAVAYALEAVAEAPLT